MKKINFLFAFILLFATAGFISSCDGLLGGSDEEDPQLPNLSVTEVEATDGYAPGSIISLEVSISSPGALDLETFAVNANAAISGASGVTGTDPVDAFDEGSSTEFTKNQTLVDVYYDYEVPANLAEGSSVTITFSASNKDGEASEDFTFTVATGGGDEPEAEVVEYTGKTLTWNSTSKTSTTALVVDGGSVEAIGTNSDVVFAWQNTYGYSLVSPDAEWITDLYDANSITYATDDKNHTKLEKVTSAWDDIDVAFLEALSITEADLSGGGVGVEDLAAGDIVVFETADGKFGAIKVTTAGAKKNTMIEKSITVDVKVLEEAEAVK